MGRPIRSVIGLRNESRYYVTTIRRLFVAHPPVNGRRSAGGAESVSGELFSNALRFRHQSRNRYDKIRNYNLKSDFTAEGTSWRDIVSTVIKNCNPARAAIVATPAKYTEKQPTTMPLHPPTSRNRQPAMLQMPQIQMTEQRPNPKPAGAGAEVGERIRPGKPPGSRVPTVFVRPSPFY
jgi:hypothetical protein